MAKKKPKKKPATEKTKTGLTVEQIEQLAAALRGTCNHVYITAARLFGKEYGEGLFDDLLKFANLFKCEECNEWLDITERDEAMSSDICTACVDEINLTATAGDEGDDDDAEED